MAPHGEGGLASRAHIEALQEWMADGGDRRIASYKTWTCSRAEAPADVTIAKVFGSWRNALRAAGFEPVGRPGFDGACRRR